mgnify:CR=1 FL=1
MKHLNLFFWDDQTNTFFIIQSLICIAINSDYEQLLKEQLFKTNIKEILNDIQLDESKCEYHDVFIENINNFLYK